MHLRIVDVIVMDRLSKEHRSWNMSRIRCRDTEPERAVRSILHRMGFRFRRMTGDLLPGKPDIVLGRHRTVVLVHGCFWHRHPRCRLAYTPKSRIDFWQRKFEANVRRDQQVKRILRQSGWNVVIVWECELTNRDRLTRRLEKAIGQDESASDNCKAKEGK